jgi:hypothetical protein
MEVGNQVKESAASLADVGGQSFNRNICFDNTGAKLAAKAAPTRTVLPTEMQRDSSGAPDRVGNRNAA